MRMSDWVQTCALPSFRQLLLYGRHPMLATLLLVAEAQHLLGRLEYLAQQLALPFVPDAGTDRPAVDDGQQQQQAQPPQALHPPEIGRAACRESGWQYG